MEDDQAARFAYAMLAGTIESAGVWRRLERFAAARFGNDSMEHNMVREQLANNLGADVGEWEDKAISVGGDAARELSLRLRAKYDLPAEDEWDTFWPSVESQRYHQLVRRACARLGYRLRKQMRDRWDHLVQEAEIDLGQEFANLPAPDWLGA